MTPRTAPNFVAATSGSEASATAQPAPPLPPAPPPPAPPPAAPPAARRAPRARRRARAGAASAPRPHAAGRRALHAVGAGAASEHERQRQPERTPAARDQEGAATARHGKEHTCFYDLD